MWPHAPLRTDDDNDDDDGDGDNDDVSENWKTRKIVPSPFTPSFCALPTAGYLYFTLEDNGLVMKPCVSINLIFTWLGICPHKSRKVL